MSHPLLWKELRESRLGLVAALLWLSASVMIFALKANDQSLPDIVEIALGMQFVLGGAGTFIMLGAGRVLAEQQRGTWDFLRTLPTPLPRVMLSKWLTATVLGAGASFLFVAIAMGSIALSGQPFDRTEAGMWLWAVPAGAVLMFAVLALIDAVNWSAWTVVRMILTILTVLGFPILFTHSETTPGPADIAAWLVAGAAIFALALRVARRSAEGAVLTSTVWPRGTRRHFASPGAAVRWATQRHGLLAAVGLTASPWLVLVLVMWLGWTTGSPVLRLEAYAIMVLLALPLAGVCCGGLDQLQMIEGRIEPFARTLPVSCVSRGLHRLAVNLGLYAAVAIGLTVPLLLVRTGIEDTAVRAEMATLVPRAVVLGLALVLLTHGLTSAAPRVGLAISGFLAFWILGSQLARYADPLGMEPEQMLFAAIAIAAALAAPWLAWRREV